MRPFLLVLLRCITGQSECVDRGWVEVSGGSRSDLSFPMPL